MNIEFVHPTLEDREWISAYYHQSGCRACECSFVNLYLWGRGYGKVAKVGDFLVQFLEFGGKKFYTFPTGDADKGDLKFAIDALIEDAKQYGHPMRMTAITDCRRERLEKLYPGRFHFTENRAAFDYLYKVENLAQLTGKKYQQKRNHCNRFEQNFPDWETEVLTEDKLPACQEMLAQWFQMHEGGEESDAMDYRIEKIALGRAFDEFTTLGMEGMLLKADGRIVAFTMGNRIQDDTFDVNFEKAFPDVQGAYPVINREFARYVREKYPEIVYLNREDDMGLPGLRRAKESYHPDVLLSKSLAELEETV